MASLDGSPAYTPLTKGSISLSNASGPRCLVTNSLTLSSWSEGGGSTRPIAPRPALRVKYSTAVAQRQRKNRAGSTYSCVKYECSSHKTAIVPTSNFRFFILPKSAASIVLRPASAVVRIFGHSSIRRAPSTVEITQYRRKAVGFFYMFPCMSSQREYRGVLLSRGISWVRSFLAGRVKLG